MNDMTRREQIIEIVKEIIFNNGHNCTDKTVNGVNVDLASIQITDKILAPDNPTWELPDEDIVFQGSVTDYLKEHKPQLDVPSDKEIENKAEYYATEEGGEDFEQMLQQPDLIAFYDGAHWMRDEILKLNVESFKDDTK